MRFARFAHQQPQAGTLVFELGRIPRVGYEDRFVTSHQQVAVVAGEPGQVGDVRDVGHQQGVDLLTTQHFA